MSNSDFFISVVVPCFNEELMLSLLLTQIKEELSSYRYEIILIDDGSKDQTCDIIKQFISDYPTLKLVPFFQNYGQQAAIYAGICEAKGNYILVMDADMQELLRLIPEMIEQLQNGYKGVFSVTPKYESVGVFKRVTARLFYRLYNLFSECQIDERIMSFFIVHRSVADDYLRLKHRHYISKIAFFALTQPSVCIEAIAPPRKYGETKYSLYKMLKLAVTSLLVVWNMPYLSFWLIHRKRKYTLRQNFE